MLSKYIEPGNRIEIQSISRARLTNAVTRQMYKSLIWDTISEDRIEVLVPIEKNKLIPLPVNSDYDLYIYTASGRQYQCSAKIVDKYKSENKHILLFELISSLKKFQRREFYRLNCTLEIGVRLLEDEEVEAVLREERFLVPGLPLKKAIVVDISGGGMRFVGRYVYKPDSFLYCGCTLNVDGKEKECVLVAKVLRMRELEDNRGTYEHRVQFVSLDPKEREEIIRFIFEEERKHRKKGIL